jgi:hypothetical protein
MHPKKLINLLTRALSLDILGKDGMVIAPG